MKKIARQQQLSVMAIEPDCTFKPKITVHTTSHVRRGDNVFERMYSRAQIKPSKSPVPDKNKFRPQTGRSPMTRKSYTGDQIGAHLYQAHQEQRTKQQQLQREKEEQLRASHSRQNVNEVSKQIVQLKQR